MNLTEEKLKVVSAFTATDEAKYEKIKLTEQEKPEERKEDKKEEAEAKPEPKTEKTFTKPPEFTFPEVPRHKIDVDAEEFSTKPVEKGEEKPVENLRVNSGKAEEQVSFGFAPKSEAAVRSKSTFLSEAEAKAIFGTSEIPPAPPVPEDAPPIAVGEALASEEPKMPPVPTKDAAIPGKTAREIP